jgi:hypothetical protein
MWEPNQYSGSERAERCGVEKLPLGGVNRIEPFRSVCPFHLRRLRLLAARLFACSASASFIRRSPACSAVSRAPGPRPPRAWLNSASSAFIPEPPLDLCRPDLIQPLVAAANLRQRLSDLESVGSAGRSAQTPLGRVSKHVNAASFMTSLGGKGAAIGALRGARDRHGGAGEPAVCGDLDADADGR